MGTYSVVVSSDWYIFYQNAEDNLSLEKSGEIQHVQKNDIIQSTIEDWLFQFKDENVLINDNYSKLVSDLKYYFENGKFKERAIPIKVGKVNKKRFGWALNNIFRSLKDNKSSISSISTLTS